jgi:signal transduction histidine kinase
LRSYTAEPRAERLLQTVIAPRLLLVILNDVLDFSKIEAGKLRMESIDFSVRQMLDEALKPLGAPRP